MSAVRPSPNDFSDLGPAEHLIVQRDGARDLAFQGWVIGDGTHTTSSGRATQVVIYLAVDGPLVTEVRRGSSGRTVGADVQHSVAVHPDGASALKWLKADNAGELGRASKAAWTEACQTYPPLASLAREDVDASFGATTDFPITRKLIRALPAWVNTMASHLPPPVKVPAQPDGKRWAYPVETAEVVQVGKAVRMVSGITAALHLADLGFTVECGTVLRAVSDFASEITFLCEGLIEGRMTKEQSKFVTDYFKPMPTSAAELTQRKREGYVARRHIHNAQQRLVAKAGGSTALFADVLGLLTKGYDSYVHGAYESAMELFTGRTRTFMMVGHESPRHRCMAKVAVAGKLHEVIGALELMALSRRLVPLHATIRSSRHELYGSREEAGDGCPDV
jgi:hypothetical protein